MKAPFQDSSSADISNRASTSSQPKNDRELGYITTSSNGNVARNNHFLKFPKQINTSLVRKVPFYVLAQVGGSVLATYTGKLVYSIKPEVMMTRPLHGCTSAFCVELISTFIILFLSTSLISEPQSLGPLSGFVAGVAISLGVLISGPVSGGSMNPARSLGPALVSWRFDHLWIYVVAPTIGAIAGVLAYRILRLQGWSCKPDPSLRTLQSSQSSLH
ncbi:UNVERIFIED_CONTAM: putative aquaporin NIP7-1 [Sesamum angustifolium]|uniref:Aquaporin NIP7-1 n=1 Tax=Sesamum angustifolium TaxID=2727405 RepID=A0AAW2NZ07_9LAMI